MKGLFSKKFTHKKCVWRFKDIKSTLQSLESPFTPSFRFLGPITKCVLVGVGSQHQQFSGYQLGVLQFNSILTHSLCNKSKSILGRHLCCFTAYFPICFSPSVILKQYYYYDGQTQVSFNLPHSCCIYYSSSV